MSGVSNDEYFIHPSERFGAAPRSEPRGNASVGPAGRPSSALPLATGSARPMQAMMAVLLALGGVVAGFAVPFLLAVFLSIGFWGSTRGDGTFFVGLGVFIAACGVAAGVLVWLPWRSTPALLFDDDRVRVRYPGFHKPLAVTRELIRAVEVDDRPVHLFHRNDRFPVEGNVPASSFADALDVHPSDPWQPSDPADRTPGFPLRSSLEQPAHAYLFSADGSALPTLRVNPEDVPNLAILLHDALPTPRPPLGALIAPRCTAFFGGRPVHGLMIRVSDATRAAAAFAEWGVLRPITADDVIDEHLTLAKPLKGVRVVVFGALLLLPVLARLLLRHRI